jgi:phage gp16-like protein
MSIDHDADSRRRDLAFIHIAVRALGMDPHDKDPSSEYRSMLWTIARVRSSKDLDFAGRKRVREHLEACGYQSRPGTKPFPGRPHNADRHPQLRKIEALLADAKRPWAYADGMAEKMFGKARVAFCDTAEWQAIIAALVKDQQRRKAKAENESRP